MSNDDFKDMEKWILKRIGQLGIENMDTDTPLHKRISAGCQKTSYNQMLYKFRQIGGAR